MSDGAVPLISSPCAACKILRKRCTEECVLAPYFPPNDPQKFLSAHKIFGASNMIRLLQDIPLDRRADAVSSMVYEASARIRDPVYGCTRAIFHLQQQLTELQSQLATAQADLLNLHLQHSNLLALINAHNSTGGGVPPEISFSPTADSEISRESALDHQLRMAEDLTLYSLYSDHHDDALDLWEPLWK